MMLGASLFLVRLFSSRDPCIELNVDDALQEADNLQSCPTFFGFARCEGR